MNPNIYLHEIIQTVPGREEPYAASVLSTRHEPARRHGRGEARGAAFVQLRTAETSGEWPCVINIWQNTWAGQVSNFETQFQDARRDTALEDWWNRNLHLRRGGYDRLLIPAPYSPTKEELRKRRNRAAVLIHEIVWLPFGEPVRYLDRVERDLMPAARRLGVDLIGAFRVALRPRQALLLLGAPEWSILARYLGASNNDPGLRAWHEYRAQSVQQAQELILLPVRHDELARSS